MTLLKNILRINRLFRGFGADSSGQMMTLSIVVLATGIITASAVSGFIVLLQLRQAVDVMDSTRAAYVSDAGLECELYRQFKAIPGYLCSDSTNIVCGTDVDGAFCQLDNLGIFRISTIVVGASSLPTIKSVGEFGRATRAFEVGFTQI